MDKQILQILEKISKASFEVAIVGGAVRDILVKKEVTDWDLTTSAKPDEILKLFPNAFYNNQFGTVGIPIKKDGWTVQVTTYRSEEEYSDNRHPDKVVWGKTLEEDLARRDFTINAMALRRYAPQGKPSIAPQGKPSHFIATQGKLSNPLFVLGGEKFEIVDLFGGQKDLNNKVVRTVGVADERFGEDALRLLRAIRFCTSLAFDIENETKKAISKNASLISKISGERIRDELFKIIQSENNAEGIFLAKEVGILKYILPELNDCFTVEQKSPKRHHIFDVGTHCVMSVKFCPSKDIIVRFATMLHDIGKAKVANVTDEGVRTFYNHEVAGAHQAVVIANRLHLSRDEREKVFKLVRWHQFSVSENQTDKALRRFIANIGVENIEDMMDLRIGDRLGGGLQQAESWRLKLYRQRLKEVLKKPFNVTDLKIDGRDVMRELNLKPGPKVGEVLTKLFDEVLEDEKKNDRKYLLEQLQKLHEKK